MNRVLVATEKPFSPDAIKKIEKIFNKAKGKYKLELLEKYKSREQLTEAVKDISALIVRSDLINYEVFEAAKNLKVVVRAGAGYDNIDLEAASAKGVVVMNTPGQNSNAVAELAIGLAIYGVRELFSGMQGGELRGRTMGLHGFGDCTYQVNKMNL